MLKFYDRHRMIVDKINETISFKQSKCLANYLDSKAQDRNQAVNDFVQITR